MLGDHGVNKKVKIIKTWVMIKGAMIKKDEAHRIVNAAYRSTIMQKLLEKNIKLGQKLLEKNIKLWSRPELLEKNMCIITAS